MKKIITFFLLAVPAFAGQPQDVKTNHIGMTLVFIPAGSFLMGSPYDEEWRQEDEKPHQVRIEQGFYMSATEVTQAQWTAVMGVNRSFHKGDSLPVEKMSWKEAVDFCARLSRLEGQTYRLPTEAEWEYACRAGRAESFSDDLSEVAWFSMNSGGETHPAAKKKPNDWGLFDMLGNVSEWCADDYLADYTAGPNSKKQARSKVIRGGAFDTFPPGCRAAARTAGPAAYKYTQTGFRVVMENSKQK